MKKIKKALKITAIFLAIGIGALIVIPIIFEDKIIAMIKDAVNDNVNAELDFKDADISLLSSFPNATVVLDDLTLVNLEPFAGDTLFVASKISLKMSMRELFKGSDESINVNYIALNDAKVNIHVNEEGAANYDIAKPSESSEAAEGETGSNQNFVFSVKKYELTNSLISYNDDSSRVNLLIEDLNHEGRGDLSLEKSELDTKTDALVSFAMDSTRYLNKNPIKLDASIGIDLKENKYAFLENKAQINQLPLVFDGFVKLNDDNQEVNVNFKTPSSDFKNFLAVIPEVYSKNIENVKTEGNFEIAGSFKGIVDDKYIPAFDISIHSENAMFKYPDLPKSVRDIQIKTRIANTTGITNDTYVDIQKLSFKIDEDTFNANAKLSNLIENPNVNMHVDGRLNLANLSQAYPVTTETKLKGRLEANVTSSFDMKSLENKQYENTKNDGVLKLNDFEYTSEEIANPIEIKIAEVAFNPTTVDLNTFDAKTGQTDFRAKGTIKNLLGFLFNNEDVDGNFDVDSNVFAISDFMVADASGDGEQETDGNNEVTPEEKIKIPSFLNATLNASVNTVLYDNLTLKNVKGALIIKDEKASLVNVTSNLFDGNLGLNGSVSTKTETPVFDMNLAINAFDIAQSFTNLDLFKALSPIAAALKGKLNTNLSLSGNLNDDFTPNLSTISGKALAELLASSIDPEKSKALSLLSSNLSFVNLKELNLDKLKTSLSFENGEVSLKPLQLNYKDIGIEISGGHSFDTSLGYQATFNVPAKYLGNEASGLIAKLGEEDAKNIKIPVTADISGKITNPSVKTDLKQVVTNLTSQLVQKQKEKLVDKGKDKVKDAVSDLLNGGSNKAKDSVNKSDPLKDTAGKLINNLFRKKEKKKDSTKN
ncbi:AsmA family protein [Flavobacteriaceae bacterium R38]|nr:AsmA family protein [Flavobacteriaceae bacterium R38]